jgi:hypothetical protein
MAGHRELVQVDLVARQDVLLYFPLPDQARRLQSHGAQPVAACFDAGALARLIQAQTQRCREPPDGVELIEQHAVPFGISRNVVEQQRRGDTSRLAGYNLRQSAHFQIPTGPAHPFQFADALDFIQPLAQIIVGCVRCIF